MAEYDFLTQSAHPHSAAALHPSANLLFESQTVRLAPGAIPEGLESVAKLLRDDCEKHLHRAAAEAVTINETAFFRDPKAFEALRQKILPALIRRNAPRRTLHIWSAGSSTGQEAYSLAMLLLERFPELAGWDVAITATDISPNVIHYAETGCFRRSEVNRGLPARLLVKYFERCGEEWCIRPELRALCGFATANLCDPLPSMPVFDLILMRNVLLHLPHAVRGHVFDQIREQISPRGFLMLGNAEQAEDFTESFEPEYIEDHCFYRPAF